MFSRYWACLRLDEPFLNRFSFEDVSTRACDRVKWVIHCNAAFEVFHVNLIIRNRSYAKSSVQTIIEPAIFRPVFSIGTTTSPTDIESASPDCAIGCLEAILDTVLMIFSFLGGPDLAKA